MLSAGREKMFDIDSMLSKTNMNLSSQAEVMSGPLQMGLDITNRCVLKCKHCFNRSPTLKRDEMEDDLLRNIFDQIKEIKPQQMCICGGEPLVREKMVIECVSKLSDAGIVMGMVTNGYLINQKNAKALCGAGVGQVQVSVDGFSDSHDRLRGVKGAYDRAIQGIKYLKDAGVSVITSFAPTKFNVEEFPKYVDSMLELGVEEVRIQPLMPLGDGQLHAEIFPVDEQYSKLSTFIKKYNNNCGIEAVQNVDNMNEIDQSSAGGFHIIWGDPVDHIIRFSKYVTKPTYTYQINSTGKIGLTPYFPITFGDVHKHSLKEYWEAGMNNIWEMDIVQRLAQQIRAVDHMSRLNPPTFFCDNIEIDLVDNTKEEIDELSELYFGKKQ